jgi:hypothetical protein
VLRPIRTVRTPGPVVGGRLRLVMFHRIAANPFGHGLC